MININSAVILLACLAAIFLVSCNSKKNNDNHSQLLYEANEFHQKSLDLREEILEMEKQLKEKGVDYETIKSQLKTWDKDIIEVPGFEHSHDDEHQRKYHVHNPPKHHLPEEEHLNYQKMMYEEIQKIHNGFQILN